MGYEDIVRLSGTWGMVYMIGIFAIAVGYALWPKNRDKFARAARLPLDEPPTPPRQGGRR